MSKIDNAQASGRGTLVLPLLQVWNKKSITSNPFSNDRSEQMSSLVQISTNVPKLLHQKMPEQR